MNDELSQISSELSDTLSKLVSLPQTTEENAQRRQKVATLIKLHVRSLQELVITNRRRSQQRSRRRFKQFRLMYMQQMMQLHHSYIESYTTLRMKHLQLQQSEQQQMEQLNNQPAKEQPLEQRNKKEEQKKATDYEEQKFEEDKNDEPKPRFWEYTVLQFSDEQFLNSFHVSRSTFYSLAEQLEPTLRRAPVLHGRNTVYSDVIPVAKCVGLALYFLASSERLSVIAEQFAVPRARTIKCLKVFCNAVMTNLGKALRLLPQSEADCNQVIAGFQRECNMPAALVGVIGVCSIPLRNNNSNSTLRMEFLLDDRMLFRELQLSHEEKPQLDPMFSHAPNSLTLLPPRRINGRMVPAFVLAPAQQKYPLRPWLMQRYKYPDQPHKHDFNEVAEHLLEMSDCALHRLMSRWRFLSQPLDISFQTASCIIRAATVLHNLLEEVSEPHMLEWGNSVDVSKFKAPPMEETRDVNKELVKGLELREFLARTISSTEMESIT